MQHRYHINVFWYPDDECWIADVPDLKSCSAHGDTPEEAIAEAQVAIELWIETASERGISTPEPRYRPAIYAASGSAFPQQPDHGPAQEPLEALATGS